MMSWQHFIEEQNKQDYFRNTLDTISLARQSGTVIYPPDALVYSAFEFTPLAKIKVVIIGQDPYHGPNQAHGLCFSVLPGVNPPPSLKNIYKELQTDIEGFTSPSHGCLITWAQQGVLLLNTVLTVEQGKAHSHAHLGWETFTDKAIALINAECEGVVFLLWGNHAQKKGQWIDRGRHHVLETVHPSPLSARRGFFGCQHFSKTNHLLQKMNKEIIDWRLPEKMN